MTTLVKIKDYKLRSSGNAKHQMVQIPISVIREWDLKENEVEIYRDANGGIVIRPK